jgi:RNA-binding protein
LLDFDFFIDRYRYTAPMSPLSSKRRSELRAEAHKLTPAVIIGDKGLTDEVVAEIDRSLRAHELIKVRAATASRENRDLWLESICERLQAHAVQQIGKVFVVYRQNLGPGPSSRSDARGDGKAGTPDARGDGGKRRREASATTKARVVSEAAREKQRRRDEKKRREREEADLKRTGRPRSRTPSPLPESGPPRRRPRTSR